MFVFVVGRRDRASCRFGACRGRRSFTLFKTFGYLPLGEMFFKGGENIGRLILRLGRQEGSRAEGPNLR